MATLKDEDEVSPHFCRDSPVSLQIFTNEKSDSIAYVPGYPRQVF